MFDGEVAVAHTRKPLSSNMLRRVLVLGRGRTAESYCTGDGWGFGAGGQQVAWDQGQKDWSSHHSRRSRGEQNIREGRNH